MTYMTRNGVEQQRQRHDDNYKTADAVLPPLHITEDDTFRLIRETAQVAQELLDDEVERVQSEAEDAAVNAVHIASVINPYAGWDTRSEIWSAAFRNAYARNNGY
jgi:hypothetical protein